MEAADETRAGRRSVYWYIGLLVSISSEHMRDIVTTNETSHLCRKGAKSAGAPKSVTSDVYTAQSQSPFPDVSDPFFWLHLTYTHICRSSFAPFIMSISTVYSYWRRSHLHS